MKADLTTTGENVVVGGENRWKYDTFVNWDFLPSESFPVLVYFRETQTPVANREEVPLVVDELDGQVHFFPAISDAKQVRVRYAPSNVCRAALRAFRREDSHSRLESSQVRLLASATRIGSSRSSLSSITVQRSRSRTH